MWRCLVLLIMAAVAAAVIDREAFKEELTEYRLQNQNLHVEKLERDFHHLEKEYAKIHSEISPKFIKKVKSRLHKAEGNFCPDKHQFQCGGDRPECIHDLLVCDGHRDCDNGMDENKDVCDTHVVAEGSSYYGIATWRSCAARGSHKVAFTIIHAERFPFFKARTFVRAAVTREYEEHGELVAQTNMAKGYYNYGQQRLVLIYDLPEEGGAANSIGVVCDFHKFDHDYADCKVVQQASLTVCATVAVARV